MKLVANWKIGCSDFLKSSSVLYVLDFDYACMEGCLVVILLLSSQPWVHCLCATPWMSTVISACLCRFCFPCCLSCYKLIARVTQWVWRKHAWELPHSYARYSTFSLYYFTRQRRLYVILTGDRTCLCPFKFSEFLKQSNHVQFVRIPEFCILYFCHSW